MSQNTLEPFCKGRRNYNVVMKLVHEIVEFQQYYTVSKPGQKHAMCPKRKNKRNNTSATPLAVMKLNL